jgi:hypothetical protein
LLAGTNNEQLKEAVRSDLARSLDKDLFRRVIVLVFQVWTGIQQL